MTTSTETCPTATSTTLTLDLYRTTLLADCRAVLARMAHSRPIRAATVPSAVRRELVDRKLAHLHTDGLITPTPRAAGYCADPSSFELL